MVIKRVATKKPSRKVPLRSDKLSLPEARDKVIKRSLKQEKEFPEYYHRGFYATATSVYHLGSLIGKKEEGNLKIVQEFYTQAALTCDWSFQVRNVTINFNLSDFRTHFNLPAERECQYKYLKVHPAAIPEEEISRTLDFEGKVSWHTPHGGNKYLTRDRLNVEARIWMHFIKNYIWPSTHTTRVTSQEALLIYLFMNEKPVDVGWLIHESLVKASYEHESKLMLPHLISSFCKAQGVADRAGDLKFKPKPPFSYASIKSPPRTQLPSLPSETVVRQEQPSTSTHAEIPSDHPQAATPDILTLLREIKDDIASTSAKCMAALNDFDGRLLRIETILAKHFQDKE